MMRYYFFPALLTIIVLFSCCEDIISVNDEISSISRLYISFEEYETSDANIPDFNVRIVTQSDSNGFFRINDTLDYVSQARGGGVIYFNPFLQSVFQTSMNRDTIQRDSALYGMTVNTLGQLNNSVSMVSPLFHKIRGLAYHRASDALFVVNVDGDRSGIFVVDRANSITQTRKPFKQFFTGPLPMWGAAYSNNRLFVSKQGEDGGIYVFDDIATRGVSGADSTASLAPSRVLAIEGARNLHGISYDTLHNVLAVTDYTDGTTVGTGRILIFDAFSSLTNSQLITPSRIITGVATTLTQPVDVALDTRATGQYLYVADRAGRVLRFLLTDNGNVAPNEYFDTPGATPVGLALDARDDSTLPRF